MKHPRVGDYVKIFSDPITKQQYEDEAVIVNNLRPLFYDDIDGHPVFRANVKFEDGDFLYSRDFSEAVA